MRVPEGWEKTRLKNIADITSGATPLRSNPKYWLDGEIPWVTTAEIKFNTILYTEEKITSEALKETSIKLYPIDTLLMAMYGQGVTRGKVAKLGVKATTNQACAAILLDNQQYCIDYFFHYLIFNYEKIRGLSNLGSQSNLNLGIIGSLIITIPPLAEQEKIAEILSTWDHAIEQTERLKANAETHKQALMQQLLTGKKRFPEFEGEWRKVRLSDYVAISNAKTTINDELPIITSSRKGIFLQEDYFKKQVASTNNIGYKIVPRGFITYRSMSDDGIFVFNRQNILDNTMVSPAYGVFQFININADFALELINSSNMLFEFNKLSQGGTRISLKTNSFKEIYIKVPSLEEQQKIAAVLNTADREIELLAEKLDHLKTEKRALMQQLLTGKRRVKVA